MHHAQLRELAHSRIARRSLHRQRMLWQVWREARDSSLYWRASTQSFVIRGGRRCTQCLSRLMYSGQPALAQRAYSDVGHTAGDGLAAGLTRGAQRKPVCASKPLALALKA